MTPLQSVHTDADWLQALHSSDSAWMVTDAGLQAQRISDGFTRMLGYSLQDLQNLKPLHQLLVEAEAGMQPHIQESLELTGAFTGELQLQSRDGGTLWVSACVNTIDRCRLQPGGTAPLVIVFTDIGFTKRFEALQRQILEDVVHEKPLQELMVRMCLELERMLPSVRVSILTVDGDDLLHPLAAPSIPLSIAHLIDGLRIGPEVGSCGSAAYLGREVITPDIRLSPAWSDFAEHFLAVGIRASWSSPIKNHEGKVIGTFALYFDTPRVPSDMHRQLVHACQYLSAIAMERDASKSRIRQLAYYDTLTLLPNRSMFNECGQQALHATRGQKALLFFLDLDRFKLWNDSLGHAAGDALLREVAQRLKSCTRPEDVVGRLSSDEFAVLMPRCNTDQMPAFAQRMLDAIAQPFSVNGVLTTPNACIGVCTYPDDGTDVEALLRHADQAMFSAKKLGSQHWQAYTAEMGQISLERADMERSLRQTLAEGGLRLHYQPQVMSSSTQQLYGVEALARWNHPEWGWVPPPRFIAVAEDTGLIHEFTRWLIDAACAQLAAWRAEGLEIAHVAVNLSTNNFHDPEFAQHVHRSLEVNGLSVRDLMLEITESVMLDTSPATLDNLSTLHSMGMRLSMDDFGTGYSSLSYLHRLPISELKLDKSFVQDVTSSAAAAALTRSVLNIATSLGMTVVAEGVETQDQADWLIEHGCPVLQGYLYAKPLPPEDMPHWVRTHTAPVVSAS